MCDFERTLAMHALFAYTESCIACAANIPQTKDELSPLYLGAGRGNVVPCLSIKSLVTKKKRALCQNRIACA